MGNGNRSGGGVAWLTILAPPLPLLAAFFLFRRMTAAANKACEASPLVPPFEPIDLSVLTLAQYAADVQGRYLFGVLAFFLLLVSLLALAAAMLVAGAARPRLPLGGLVAAAVGLVLAVTLGLLLTTSCVRLQLFDFVMCDGARCLEAAAAGEDIRLAMGLLLVARGLALSAALALAVAALAAALDPPGGVPWSEARLYDMHRALRNLLTLGAVMLVLGVFSFGALFEWSGGLIADDSSRKNAGVLASGVLLYWGAISSLALLLAFGPAYGALWLAGRDLAAAERPDDGPAARDAWLRERGLSFTISTAFLRFMTALLPVLSAPAFEVVVKAAGAVQGG